MKRIEIIQDEKTDRNIFFMYENEELVGVNFHQVIDATDDVGGFDQQYAINDKSLFDIYCEIQNESVPIGVNMEFDKVAVANEAIGKFLIINNELERKAIIEEEVEVIIKQLFINCNEKCYTKSGDISLMRMQLLKVIQNNLHAIILEQINQNLE